MLRRSFLAALAVLVPAAAGASILSDTKSAIPHRERQFSAWYFGDGTWSIYQEGVSGALMEEVDGEFALTFVRKQNGDVVDPVAIREDVRRIVSESPTRWAELTATVSGMVERATGLD